MGSEARAKGGQRWWVSGYGHGVATLTGTLSIFRLVGWTAFQGLRVVAEGGKFEFSFETWGNPPLGV